MFIVSKCHRKYVIFCRHFRDGDRSSRHSTHKDLIIGNRKKAHFLDENNIIILF